MNVVSPKPLRSAGSTRALSSSEAPGRLSDEKQVGTGRYCLMRALEAARVLENPDSSEEDQQAARESISDALSRMLSSR
ncbi:MAG: hypothetical protein ACP5HU_08230 [Phycisphaerae bacterium]